MNQLASIVSITPTPNTEDTHIRHNYQYLHSRHTSQLASNKPRQTRTTRTRREPLLSRSDRTVKTTLHDAIDIISHAIGRPTQTALINSAATAATTTEKYSAACEASM